MVNKVRIVITGNPGVGKHTCAKLIAEKINGTIIDINHVAITNDAVIKNSDDLGLDIDVKKLKRLLAGQLKKIRGNIVIVGHIAPYVLKSSDISAAAVLRRSPYLLAETFKSRGYTDAKAQENMASEILGVSFFDALKAFGKRKTYEFDTTDKTPTEIADEITSALSDRSKRRTGVVDWLSLVADRGDIEKFFEYDPTKYSQ